MAMSFRSAGVRLKFLETPGHTPESICILVTDLDAAIVNESAHRDTLFIGDVGRPDLSPNHTPQIGRTAL